MKQLNIKNFTKSVMDIYSDYFTIKYCSDTGDRYIIGIDTKDVVSFKPLESKHYKLAIHKEELEGEAYDVWIWDMGRNVSYPMNIYKRDLESTTDFARFLNHTLALANEGSFSGVSGNKITFK